MTRSGYSEDLDWRDLAMWRGQVASAIRGKRGQALLRDIAAYMDAMPEKSLAASSLLTPDGEVCALGCAFKQRRLTAPVTEHPYDFDADWTARKLDIAECLAKEVTYVNDEYGARDGVQRWALVRKWVSDNLQPKEPTT